MSQNKVITMSKPQEDTLNTTDKQQSSDFIKALDDTPFAIVKQGNLYFGIIGNHRVTEEYTSEKECIKDLKKITWNRLIQVIWTVVDKFTKVENKE